METLVQIRPVVAAASASLTPAGTPSESPLSTAKPGHKTGGGFKYIDTLERRIVRRAGRCVGDFGLIEDGDHIMVCCSGGKDSYALLDVLLLLRRTAPITFTLTAINVDQGYAGYEQQAVAAHLERRAANHEGLSIRLVSADFRTIMEAKLAPEATPCSLCSRLRRGLLYSLATEIGATKIALGHHADDLVETLLLNIFFSGKVSSMPPKLVGQGGKDQGGHTHVVIRPLAYNFEADLAAYAEVQKYPIVGCACPSCGLPDQQRQRVKRMLTDLEAANPGIKHTMLASLSNIKPSHMLDRGLVAALAKSAWPDGISRDILETPERVA